MRASTCTTEMQDVPGNYIVSSCAQAYIGSTELIVCSRLGGTPTKECCIQLDWGELCIAGYVYILRGSNMMNAVLHLCGGVLEKPWYFGTRESIAYMEWRMADSWSL